MEDHISFEEKIAISTRAAHRPASRHARRVRERDRQPCNMQREENAGGEPMGCMGAFIAALLLPSTRMRRGAFLSI